MVTINEIAEYLTIPGEDDKQHPDVFRAGIIDLKLVIYTGDERKIIDMGRGFQILTNPKMVTNPEHDFAVISEVIWMKLWNIAGFILESNVEDVEGGIQVINRFWFNPVTFNAITWQLASISGDIKYNHPIVDTLKGLFGNAAFHTHTTLLNDQFARLSPDDSEIGIYTINNLHKTSCNKFPTVAIIVAPNSVISTESANRPLEAVLSNTLIGTDFSYKFNLEPQHRPDISFIDMKNPILAKDLITRSAEVRLKIVINYESKCLYNCGYKCHVAYCDDLQSDVALKTCMNNDIFNGRNQLIISPNSDNHFKMYLSRLVKHTAKAQTANFDKYEFILRHIMNHWRTQPIIFDLVEAVFNHSGCAFAKYHRDDGEISLSVHDGEISLSVLDGVRECKYIPRIIIRQSHGMADIVVNLNVIYFIDMED